MSRRQIAAFLSIALALLVIVGCGSSSDNQSTGSETSTGGASTGGASEGGKLAGQSLTFTTFGGDQDADYKQVYTGPVEEETGLTINYDSPTDYTKVQAQVESGNVDWDVVQADPWWVEAHCGTLAEPLHLDQSDVLPEYAAGECGVPADVASYNVMYDSEQFKSDPPKSWADFFNTKKYPGKRAVWGAYAVNGMIEGALLADGVKPDELYPLDLERAFEKLDTIRSDISFYTTVAQAQEMMRSGSVSMGVLTNVNGYFQAHEGGSFVPIWNEPIVYWDAWFVPKGGNVEAAMPVLEKILDPKAQLGLTEIAPRAAAVKAPAPKLSGQLAEWSAAEPGRLSSAVFQDQSYYAKNNELITQRWTEWVAGE